MKYKLLFSKRAKNEISKLDNSTSKLLKGWVSKHLTDCENPRVYGKDLSGNMSGYWRYRIGDYRLICEIHDDELIVLAITFGHRFKVYND